MRSANKSIGRITILYYSTTQTMQKDVLLLLLLFATYWQLSAQDEPKQVTNTFLLENATIIPAPGKMIEKGSVLIKDGVIQAVGPNVTAPFDA